MEPGGLSQILNILRKKLYEDLKILIKHYKAIF